MADGRLNLRGATLSITVSQDTSGSFLMQMLVLRPRPGRRAPDRHVLSRAKPESEEDLWKTIRDMAQERLCELGGQLLEPPEGEVK